MLSISNVQNTKAAAAYYEVKDDYYTAAGSQTTGKWSGGGAAALGLHGPVEHETFAGMLAGELVNGKSIHRAAGGHRAGVDLTFSAPKTVSLMALLAGDERVAEAHAKAVDKAMRVAEERAGFRLTSNEVTTHQRSGNLVVAQFPHELSRACDPQLHTHCVVINATQRSDGEWRALDNEPLYRAKMLLGAIYRAELASELQALGYEIRVTHTDGRFELTGFEPDVIKAFSQRAQAMEEHLTARGARDQGFSALEKKQAAIATRVAKTEVDRSALGETWRLRLAELGAELPAVPAAQHESSTDPSKNAALAVDQAIHHLSEREAVFTQDDLVRSALQFGTGRTIHAEVTSNVQQRMGAGTLVSSGAFLTTPLLQQEEAALLTAESNDRNTLQRLLGGTALRPSGTPISDEQATAVHHVLGSQSRAVGIVGKAGTGKTTTLSTAVESLKTAGISVFGVAPSSSASRQLAEAGMTTSTVAAFLHNKVGAKVGKGGVLIVDEAGMVSTRQMAGLMASAQEFDFRLVLVGDPGQLSAIEAGKPFAQLIAAGLPTASLREVHRQRDETLKRAVEHAASGKIHDALATIKHRINEVPARAERLEAVAAAYAELSPAQRAETIVVSGTRASREQLNLLIRAELGLRDDGPGVRTLERKDLTRQLAASITSYEAGDVVIADRDYPSLRLRRGDHAAVVKVTGTSVMLSDANGGQVAWSPALTTGLTVHRLVHRSIVPGDLVRITANMHSEGLVNGDQVQVLQVEHEGASLTVALTDGTTKQLSLSRPLPLDHAYCRTVYASQGATCERVFIEADTSSLTSNQGTFYVALSRARSEVAIFTDDAEHLAPAMSRSHAKSSALDLKPHGPGVEAAVV